MLFNRSTAINASFSLMKSAVFVKYIKCMFYETIILSKVEIYLLYSTLKNKTGDIQSTETHSFVMIKKKVSTKQNIICCMDSK